MLAFLRISVALVFVCTTVTATPIQAATASGSVVARVLSVDGAPIAQAQITLSAMGDATRYDVDRGGNVAIDSVTPGTYAVSATAPGFATLPPQPLAVRAGAPTEIAFTLARSASSLATIGFVTTAGSAGVSSSTAPIQTLRTQDYAARGFTRVSDVLADALSATVIRQGSGSAAAPQSVALRGPDPTETLVDIDGHEINSGISGDFDLSLLDPADFENVQLVYGIAPSTLLGPSTIGGAINVRTLEPTARAHGLMRVAAGTYASFAQTLQATGTTGAFGYAFSLHTANTANGVSKTTVTNRDGDPATVGSDVDSASALAKIRYAFGRARGAYAQLTVRDQSSSRDLSAALTSLVAPGTYATSVGSRLLGHNAGYGFDLQLPLDADRATGAPRTVAIFRHLTSYVTQSVDGPASGTATAFFNDRDRIDDDTLEIDRTSAHASIALKYRVRGERLDTFDPTLATNVTDHAVGVRPLGIARSFGPHTSAAVTTTDEATSTTVSGLAQRQDSLAVRLSYEPTSLVHYTVAAYQSAFSTFGHSFDPRVGVAYTPSTRTSIHASAGTTFQAPQLTALYVPSTLPAPDANGHVNIGNPHLRADHATEYGLGFEQMLGGRAHTTRLSADVYRTNLRTPAQRLVPTATCVAGAPSLACASYPINSGNAVYTGAEFRLERKFDATSTLRLGYGIDSTYALSAPEDVQNGSIVPHEQFLGVPLHKATFAFEHRPMSGIAYDASVLYEGRYNELDRAAFATLRASVGLPLAGFDVVVTGSNLTNVYADRFTRAAAGVVYGGIDAPIATDAFTLQGRAITVSVARHF